MKKKMFPGHLSTVMAKSQRKRILDTKALVDLQKLRLLFYGYKRLNQIFGGTTLQLQNGKCLILKDGKLENEIRAGVGVDYGR